MRSYAIYSICLANKSLLIMRLWEFCVSSPFFFRCIIIANLPLALLPFVLTIPRSKKNCCCANDKIRKSGYHSDEKIRWKNRWKTVKEKKRASIKSLRYHNRTVYAYISSSSPIESSFASYKFWYRFWYVRTKWQTVYHRMDQI